MGGSEAVEAEARCPHVEATVCGSDRAEVRRCSQQPPEEEMESSTRGSPAPDTNQAEEVSVHTPEISAPSSATTSADVENKMKLTGQSRSVIAE